MPLFNGAEATRQIRARLPRTEVLIFTIHDDEMLVRELLCAGARGYVLKSDSRLDLLSVGEHKAVFTTKVAEALLASFVGRSKGEATTLSDRERSVVQLIAEGHTNKEVATILNMSLNVVETQRASLMRKLDLASSAAIVRYAIRNGFIEP
jgi:DNA-binding NarL/FixJ family response regulator